MQARLGLSSFLFLFGSLVAGRSEAASQLVTHFSLFYFSEYSARSVENGDNDYLVKNKDTYTFLSLGLCYNISPLCLGLKYLQSDKDSSLSRSGNRGDSKSLMRIKGPGLTLGYADDSLFAEAVYYIGASKELSNGDTSLFGGDGSADLVFPVARGLSLEVGYGFKAGSVRVGPLLSINSFTYKKVSFAGRSVALPADEKDEFWVPQVAIWVDL